MGVLRHYAALTRQPRGGGLPFKITEKLQKKLCSSLKCVILRVPAITILPARPSCSNLGEAEAPVQCRRTFFIPNLQSSLLSLAQSFIYSIRFQRELMSSLLVKLLFAPTLVLLASLAGRKWGPRMSGWLGGFPIVAGPILLSFALERGPVFASEASINTVAGTISWTAFTIAYSWMSKKFSWPMALISGWLLFIGASFPLGYLKVGPFAMMGISFLCLSLSFFIMPREEVVLRTNSSSTDLPLRLSGTALLVLALTAVSGFLGPVWSGLLAPFPISTTILAVFAHRSSGHAAVNKVLRGMVTSVYGLSLFCTVLAISLKPLGTLRSFLLSTFSCAVFQSLIFLFMRKKLVKIDDYSPVLKLSEP